MKREIILTDLNVDAMEKRAAAISNRDYLILALMGRRGLRVGEIVGCHETHHYVRKKTCETVAVQVDLPGVTRSDVRDGGVWVKQKGGSEQLKTLPRTLGETLVAYAEGFHTSERLFPLSEQSVRRLCEHYARAAGLADWERVHPHRWRHYFGTLQARRTGRDPWKVRALMGHKDLRATAKYVENLSPQEERDLLG